MNFSFGYIWAILSSCSNQTVNACSGCRWCWAWAAAVFWLGLLVSHRGVTSSTQGPPSSVPPIITADRQQEKKSISSIRQTPFTAHTGPGARMILLTLALSLLTASQASGELVQLAWAWLAHIILCATTQMGPYADGSVTVCWYFLSCLICHV